MDAVHRADVDARPVFDVDAGLGDDVRHGAESSRSAVSSATSSRGRPLHERRLDDHLVEAGRVRALKPGAVGVVREAHDRDVRPRVGDLLGLDARDVGDHEIGWIDAVARDEAMLGQQPLELASEEEVDPGQQDRRHDADTSTRRRDNRDMGLERGLELIRAGEYFEAHEELEDEWRDAPAAERDFLQGLVHVAVAWHHAGRATGRAASASSRRRRVALNAYRPSHRGVDVEAVIDGVEQAQRVVASGSLSLAPPPV